MWFKSIHIYRLNSEFELSPEQLAEKLTEKRFTEVGRQDTETLGWISPIDRNLEHLVHAANGCILLCMRKEQKVIPASMVKETLEERVKTIEVNEGRKVYGKERSALKDDILSLLKPKALSKSSHIWGYIDTRKGYLIINAGSSAIADAFIQLLIDSLGTLGAVKLLGKENPSLIMNKWLLEGMPDDWALTGQFELKDPVDERQAKYKESLEIGLPVNATISELMEDGFWIEKLGVQYKELFSAVIQSDMQVKSIKFSDELLQDNEDIDDQDKMARFDADFVLMSQTFAEFIADYIIQFDVVTESL